MRLAIPENALVLLIGPAGSGKSTFAQKRFRPTQVLSSDNCRELVSDDEGDQTASGDAFEVLHSIAEKRLKRRLLTVIDASNVQVSARKTLLALAGKHQIPTVAIVLNLPASVCIKRITARGYRPVPPEVVRKQVRDLRRSLVTLKQEGLQRIHILGNPKEIESAVLKPKPRGVPSP